MDISNEILSEITVHMKYARYLEDKQRRETWDELVTRNMNAVMFLAMLSTSSLLSKNCNTKSLLQKRLFAQSKAKGTNMELSRNP